MHAIHVRGHALVSALIAHMLPFGKSHFARAFENPDRGAADLAHVRNDVVLLPS
jgi:hypothetical protein